MPVLPVTQMLRERRANVAVDRARGHRRLDHHDRALGRDVQDRLHRADDVGGIPLSRMTLSLIHI